MTLLDRATKADVIAEPFPHLVIRGALDDGLCRRLVAEFPPVSTITAGQPPGSNLRFSHAAYKVAADKSIANVWQLLVREHVSQAFLDQLIHLFGDHIRREYPQFESQYNRQGKLRAGVRGSDSFERADLLLDAQICVNTPVIERPSSVRGPHVDQENKLFAGLFYLRADDDDSEGGDLEIFRLRDPNHVKFWNAHTTDEYVLPVSRVRYERNTLVLFLNTWKSLHGVTVRSITPHPRLFLNLVAEVRQPLFQIASRRPAPWTWAARQVQRLFQSPRAA